MKRIIAFWRTIAVLTFLIKPLPMSAQDPYTATLRVGLLDTTTTHSEWRVPVYLDVFDAEHNHIPVNDGILYYTDQCDRVGWRYHQNFHSNGLVWDGNKIKLAPDCCNPCGFQSYILRADFEINGFVVSAQTRLPDEGTGAMVFKQPVLLEQERQSGEPFGYVGLWVDNTFLNYPTGVTHYLFPNSRRTVRGNQNLISTPSEKYRVWRRGAADQLDTVQNHRGFTLTSDLAELISRFNQTENTITIKTDLLDATGTTGGNVQFRDPWYIDYPDPNYANNLRNRGMADAIYHDRSSPFYPDFNTLPSEQSYRGVFLNQSFASGTYYSVGAPNPNTINGFTSYFLNWGGTSVQYQNANASQTGVVFTNSNATATAKYKAHLGSSLATAAGPNSQRKLVRRASYHGLVYSSAGDVWYTFSTDNGGSWSKEERVSASAEGSQRLNPALDISGIIEPTGPTYAYIAYEIVVNASQRYLMIKKRTSSGWTWIYDQAFMSTVDIKPAIEVTKTSTAVPGVAVVVQASGLGTSDPGLYFVYIPNNGGAIQVGKVSETSASSINPTLTWYNLAYQDGNAIYQKRLDYTTTPLSFRARQLVSSDYVNGRLLTDISNPSIAIRYGTDSDLRPVTAWQAKDLVFQAYRPVFVRHPVSTSGGNPVFVTTVFDWEPSNAHGRYPTATCYTTGTFENPDVSLVWQDDPSDPNGSYASVVAANKISGSWSAQATLATSSASSSVAQGDVSQTSSGGALIVRTGSSGPPYALTASERTNIGQIDGPIAKVNSTSMDYARSVNVDLAGTGINGLRGVLSLYIRNAPRFGLRHLRELPSVQEDFLRLQTQSPIPDEISYVLSLCDVRIPNGIGREQLRQRVCALQVSLNGREFQTLGAITVNDLSALWNTRTSDTIRVVQRERAFRVPAVGHVRFSVEPFFFNNPDHVVLIEEITLADTSSTRLAKSASHEVLPQAFFLHPNYPNPFNPSTQIKFDLPEDGFVSLNVFDVLGRKVAALVNEYRAAGYHTSTWNASSVASGVYFARFTATDVSGKVKLSKVNKLLLTK